MQASGVEPSDACIATYQQEFKLGKKARYILFAVNDDNTEIVVDKTSPSPPPPSSIPPPSPEENANIAAATHYDGFVRELPKDRCRWAVYDLEFDKDGVEGKRNKIGFISWSPDAATIKEKMVFASSRVALRRRLDGIAFDVQGTDLSEISYAAVLDKALTSTH